MVAPDTVAGAERNSVPVRFPTADDGGIAEATGSAPTSCGGVAGGAEATLAPGGGPACPGSAANKSLASRAITAGSNGAPPASGLLILMVAIHLDAFEHAERILSERYHRAIERNQVGSDRLAVDAHEPD